MSAKKSNSGFTILYAGQEQTELDFAPFLKYGISAERAKLRTGDYTIKGYEHHFTVERKSLNDLVNTLIHDRERFMREVIDRMSMFAFRGMVVEASEYEIMSPYNFSAANPRSVENTLETLQMPPTNVHVFCNRDRRMCAWKVAKWGQAFIHRVTHGIRSAFDSLFDEDGADLAPLPLPYKTIG